MNEDQENTLIPLSIRDFALPSPRTGSIESHSGYGRSSEEGILIHQRFQELRTKQSASYRAEFKLTKEFTQESFLFRVSGRADGLFETDPIRIEEIKSCFDPGDLKKKLSRDPSHPYCLQLKTYGYFYWLTFKKAPKLNFLLVSTRTGESEEMAIELDIAEYEAWLERRLTELVEEAKRALKRAQRRKKLAKDFPFPFENPRARQIELIEVVDEALKAKRPLMVQAPTGLGKTIGVLYPALKNAMELGQRVIYVTPKNSQHEVAEDAINRFESVGSKLKSLTVTAKSKSCLKNEPLCNPEYCEYAKDHYTKVHANGVPRIIAKKRRLTKKVFKELGEQFEICPFELQIDAAKTADVVICDYNYVFSPRSSIGKLSDAQMGEEGKPTLVIDEAHNLFWRAMDYFSPELSTYVLESMRPSIRLLPSRFRSEAEQQLNACIQAVLSCQPEKPERSQLIDAPAEVFLQEDFQLRQFLARYLNSDVEIEPRDVVLRLCFYWSEFTAALQYVAEPRQPHFFTTYRHQPSGSSIKITCCDASTMLEEIYGEYQNVVAFSATLKPFDYYAKLAGLSESGLKVAEFQSPFPAENRKLLIIPEISTKYSARERNYDKICQVISKVAAIRPGNYLAFFPSFEFLENVLRRFPEPEGFLILKQEKEMRANQITPILEHLRSHHQPTILFAVQGGVFSEGVDYPGESVIGAFIVGPPLPVFDKEREEMRKYYDSNYGSGFDYAYSYPAMAKAVQAAGRVIRSETDKGLIVLMDDRFIQTSYSASMPGDWFGESPRELVSRSILKEVTDFWNEV